MPFVAVRTGIKIHYERVGKGSPLLFIMATGLDHTCWAPTLVTVGSFDVAGHSMGGMAAQQFCVDFAESVSGLILVNTIAADLPHLNIPTLVIGTASDASATPLESKTLAELIPNPKLVIIDGAGHFPMLETPKALNNALEEFLLTHHRRSGV